MVRPVLGWCLARRAAAAAASGAARDGDVDDWSSRWC